MDQLCCKLGQSLDPPACKSIFDVDVLPLDVTKVTQPLTEGVDFRRGSGRAVMQETDPRDFRGLLRARRKRPRRRRAAKQRDELAASDESCHLIPPAGRLRPNDSTVERSFRGPARSAFQSPVCLAYLGPHAAASA